MSPPLTLDDLTPRDYREPLSAIAANVKTFVEQHPDSFDCLLYRANPSEPEVVTTENDVVGSIESTERALTYADPVPCRAVKIPDTMPCEVDIEDTLRTPDAEPVALLLSENNVPAQSVIQYREYKTESEIAEITLYVLKTDWTGDGTPAVCQKHYCLPMQQFENLKS